MQLLLAFKSLVAPFRFPAGFDYLVINMRVLTIWLGAKRAKGRKFTGLKRVRIIHKKKIWTKLRERKKCKNQNSCPLGSSIWALLISVHQSVPWRLNASTWHKNPGPKNQSGYKKLYSLDAIAFFAPRSYGHDKLTKFKAGEWQVDVFVGTSYVPKGKLQRVLSQAT